MKLARSVRRLAGLLASPLLFACSEQTIEVELHSLQASGEVSFVCRSGSGRGLDRSLCPSFDEEKDHRIYALVTQRSTEEVAIIDTFAAEVIDIEPSAPGYSFLRVPARPGAITSSPGGAATFVGLMGPDGKSGITAIPTTCLGPPKSGETARDVTTFASCHLPKAPGDITVLVVPPESDGTVRESCDPASGPEAPPLAASRAECPADLTKEHEDEDGNVVGPVGRRKLAVAIPDQQEIVIIDAQWLLDQTPGSFPECRIEARLPLTVDLGPAGLEQSLDDAPELVPEPGCSIQYPEEATKPPSYLAYPAGFAEAGGLLYVADRNAPVIHVLDVSNPCAPNELPSLLPRSFENPNREVLTSKVAASPLTPDGRRYVYAVDDTDVPKSLMMFDVSPGSTNRTPLVRPGSLRVPEPPDRVKLGTAITDIAFALRDLEATDPDTGVAESGVRCDPNPDADPSSPGALHRPTSDKSRGAQPRLLRGLFGLAMLTTGHVAIVDVDDFDAPCRRPYTTNDDVDPDFRGCAGDTELPPFLTLDKSEDGAPTVTNEVSCNVVAPHRLRAAVLNTSNNVDGIGAASLVAFPEFTRVNETTDLPQQNQPKLLAVPFEPVAEQVPPEPMVYVGTTLHSKTGSARIETDPNTATSASLTLPFDDPRAHPAADQVVLTFEGTITPGALPNGRVVFDPDDDVDPGMRLEDASAQFCDRGVYDLDMLGDLSRELGIDAKDTVNRDLFARRHADVVEITSELLPVEDEYWRSQRLFECGVDYTVCTDTFGIYDPAELNQNRELVILEAYQDRLSVEPLSTFQTVADEELDVEEKLELTKKVACCFPQGFQYRVHVRNQWVVNGAVNRISHDVTVKPETLPDERTHYRCVRDCDPRKKYHNPRVFEISTDVDCAGIQGEQTCAVGKAEAGDPCRYDPCERLGGDVGPCTRADGSLRLRGPTEPGGPIQPGDEGALACIHSGITSRFAVYRGLSPSERGMQFTWQTSGGFRSLLTSIASVSIAVLPQQVSYVPEIQRIAIVDGAQLGLTLVSLDALRVEDPWPVY